MVPAKKKAPQLEGGHSTKNDGMWNLKHETSSLKLYELLTKTEIKGETALELKNFYKNINMCLNAVTRLWEDLLTTYQYIKRRSDFEEYFILDHMTLTILGMLRPKLPRDDALPI